MQNSFSELDNKNIDEIKEILKSKSIREFFKSGFEDFNMIEKTHKSYFSIYTPNNCSYIIYKSHNGEIEITQTL